MGWGLETVCFGGKGAGLWAEKPPAEVGGLGQEPWLERAHVLQEAGAQLAQVGLLPVELLLQRLYEGLLASVDVLYVSEDGAQLLLAEHVCTLATLPNVALGTGVGQSGRLWTLPHAPQHSETHLTDVAQVLDVVPLRAEDLVDDIGAHLVPAALCLGPAVLGSTIPSLQCFVVLGLVLVHPQLQVTLLVSALHPCGDERRGELGFGDSKRCTETPLHSPLNNAHLDTGTTGLTAAVNVISDHSHPASSESALLSLPTLLNSACAEHSTWNTAYSL